MTQIIHGRVDTKAYKEAMKKNGLQMPSIEKRVGLNLSTLMESYLFLVKLKHSAELSVLKQLGISSKVLRSMGVMELKTLSRILGASMLEVDKEIQRRK